MKRTLTLADLMACKPSPKDERRMAKEYARTVFPLFSHLDIDPDRIKEWLALTCDHSKSPKEHARDFFTPEEQAKLPGLK